MGIKQSICKFGTKLMTSAKAKSPTILVITGTVTLITAGVVAAVETHKKLDGVIAEHKEKVAALKDIRDGVVVLDEYTTEEYAANHYKKHLTTLYLQTICKLAKIYAPAFILALIGTLSILKGHKILSDRYVAKVAECVLANQTLREYRKRVADQIGEQAEKNIFFNGDKQVVNRKVTDENGEEKDVLEEAFVGPNTKMSWTYVVSRDTATDILYGRSDGDFRRMLEIIRQQGNQYFRMHDQVTLFQLMGHWFKDAYMYDNPEVMTNGWKRNAQFEAEGYDSDNPITYTVKEIDDGTGERKYAVTWNVQCDVYADLVQDKKRKKFEKNRGRKVTASVRPAVA